MPFTNLTNLGATATFNELFNSHNTLISRGNSLGIGSIFAGNGITATSLDSSGGITLSARLNQGSGIQLTQGAGITIGLNTAFITGGTGINVSSSTSGITVSVKLNAGTSITLDSGPAGVTINSSGGGGGSTEATFGNSGTSTSIAVPSGGTSFGGKTALQILETLLFPYVSVSFSGFTSGLGAILFELGQTAGNGSYTAGWLASSPILNWIAGSGGLSFQNFGSAIFTGITSGFSPTGGSRSWTNAAFRGTTFTSDSNSNRILIRLSGGQTQGNPPVADQTIRWWSKSYWGRSSSDPTARTSLVDGSETFIQTTPGTSSTFTAGFGSGASQHLYILIPDNYTISTFIDTSNNLQSPFTVSGSVNIENAQGLSILYKRYKSENPVAGAITLNATYN